MPPWNSIDVAILGRASPRTHDGSPVMWTKRAQQGGDAHVLEHRRDGGVVVRERRARVGVPSVALVLHDTFLGHRGDARQPGPTRCETRGRGRCPVRPSRRRHACRVPGARRGPERRGCLRHRDGVGRADPDGAVRGGGGVHAHARRPALARSRRRLRPPRAGAVGSRPRLGAHDRRPMGRRSRRRGGRVGRLRHRARGLGRLRRQLAIRGDARRAGVGTRALRAGHRRGR